YVTTIVKKDGSSLVGTPMSEAVEKVVLGDKKEFAGPATINDKKYQTGYVPLKDVNGEVVGAYFAGYSSEEIDKMFIEVVLIVIGVAVVLAVAIVVFMSMQMRKLVVNPIKEINRVAGDLRVGELGNEGVNITPTNDEVGDTSVAINDMKNALNSYIADLSRVMSAMAQGDFTVMPQVEYKGDFVALCESAKLINDEMHTVLYSIGESADQVLSGSTQSANGSEALAGGTTRQAAAIEELSASLNEISKRVKSTAENAEEAKSLSADATEKMNRQHEYMRNMLSAMKEISEKSSEINTIINAISDVAFQTNILALNAAVEAARAGESGRGFAVVADEVRVLASKSAEAVNTTTELVEATIKAVERGEDIANMNAEALENVIKIFGSTSKIIDDISLAAGEQADSIGQITSGITEISDVVQQNSATAEEIAASCEQLNGQSTELRNSVKKFRI
ncbi:MAG: methyl-accepting chemotaxis protein, partial [Oscillospiraceae bacterium]|nr:methyl-accepting chemotaxis protein [Oscillospiraceae bacterium]